MRYPEFNICDNRRSSSTPLTHSIRMDVSILIIWMSLLFIFRGIGSIFSFLFHFSMKLMQANRIATDGSPHFAASHLGLFSLPMSHRKDTRLILRCMHSTILHFDIKCRTFFVRNPGRDILFLFSTRSLNF